MLIFLTVASFFLSYTVDDAFISYRFAENFAGGHGLVFNIGDKVEGYTNFLWVVILGIAHFLGLNTIIISKVFGLLLGMGTIFLGYWTALLICRTYRVNEKLALAAPFILAIAPSNILYSINGMESQLFAFLLSAGTFFFIKEVLTDGFPVSSIFFGLLALTRPEGYIFCVLFQLYFIIIKRKIELGRLLLVLAIALPHIIWKKAYYGYFLPNTYYAKEGGPLFLKTSWGMKYIKQLLTDFPNGILVILSLASFVFVIKFKTIFWTVPSIITAVFLGYIYYAGGDINFPYFRFFIHMMPVACLGVILFLVGLFSVAKNKIILYVLLIFAIISGAFMIKKSVSIWKDLMPADWRYMRLTPLAGHWANYPEIGRWLKDNVGNKGRVVMQDVGAIPYYSGVNTIDIIGLVNKELAHYFYDNKYTDYLRTSLPQTFLSPIDNYVNNYLLNDLKVEYVLYIVNASDCSDFRRAFHYHNLIYDKRFVGNYSAIQTFKRSDGTCNYVLFKRNGI